MVEINENTQIEEVEEAQEYTELNQVQDDLKAYKIRLNSMMEKNQDLQNKISVVNKDQMTLVIPKTFIKEAIEEQINKMQDDVLDQVKTANDVLSELRLVENQSALQDLEELSNFNDRLGEVEYKVDDKIEQNDLEDEISNYVSEFKEEYEINDMIDSAIDDNRQELTKEWEESVLSHLNNSTNTIAELQSKVEVLTAKNNNIVSRVIHWLKGLFTPNK